jgi:hypothetical protein
MLFGLGDSSSITISQAQWNALTAAQQGTILNVLGTVTAANQTVTLPIVLTAAQYALLPSDVQVSLIGSSSTAATPAPAGGNALTAGAATIAPTGSVPNVDLIIPPTTCAWYQSLDPTGTICNLNTTYLGIGAALVLGFILFGEKH